MKTKSLYNFDEKLLDMLCCPETGEKLIYQKSENILISEISGIKYNIFDGIPILLRNKNNIEC